MSRSPDPGRIEEIFGKALDLDPAGRLAYVEEEADGDTALYEEVLSLLEVHARETGPTWGAIEPDRARRLLETVDGSEGQVVGPFRLGPLLGVGGMGAVHRAERVEGGFEQTVALKLVKKGMDSASILARFEQERQILARLDHPAIARLVDGGLARDGRPYFAMEYVESGESLTDAADRRDLSVEERLGLILEVCGAVAEAHRNLVVHCDLKPSNILVAEDGRVKLLDFGIAKVLEADAEGPATRYGVRALTPDYASPEQLRGEKATTASDVYALGVVLYELLAGTLPYEARGGGPAAMSAAPRSEPAPASTTARRQLTGPVGEVRARRLRGDLDAILSRALALESNRRYPTVDALAADLRRHLEGRPVEARPPSRLSLYRLEHAETLGRAALATRRDLGDEGAIAEALVGLAATLYKRDEHASPRVSSKRRSSSNGIEPSERAVRPKAWRRSSSTSRSRTTSSRTLSLPVSITTRPSRSTAPSRVIIGRSSGPFSPTWPTSISPRESSRSRKTCAGRLSPCRRRFSVGAIRTLRPRSWSSPERGAGSAPSRRPRRFCGRHSMSRSRPTARSTPKSRPVSTAWRCRFCVGVPSKRPRACSGGSSSSTRRSSAGITPGSLSASTTSR